ncbi:AAA family ATPase [Candidatus Saccharibacteria bacterium]|nr:AAA family ATPase [Candidatus Saccharibacteria bacterium]
MTLADLVLHTKVRQRLENYSRQPTHALLLIGEKGVGLGTIARTLAKEIAPANVAIITPRLHDKQKTSSINIDDIRELAEFTRDRRSDPICVIIDEAEKMTVSAPEAFLKGLEEPVAQVFYILTTHKPAKLPATIKSRAQTIEILPPLAEMCESLFARTELAKGSAKLAKVKFLGDRRPAEIVRLLTDEEYFDAATALMETAKHFIQGDPAKRLSIVANCTTRDEAILLVQNIAKLLLLSGVAAKNSKAVAHNLHATSEVIDRLAQNGNVRMQLTYLALNI